MKNETDRQTKNHLLPASILLSTIIIFGAVMYKPSLKINPSEQNPETASVSGLEEKVLPSDGVILPIRLGDLEARLVDTGAIDENKFKTKKLLLEQNDDELKITTDNAGYLLNIFWALGLAQKNPILETGEMMNPKYGGAGNFASTGGWVVARGNPMDHYSKHEFFSLTSEQQTVVDKVSRGIYRPCCGNATNFPDCNHGMAMLGLLELMASQGVSEEEMWNTALTVNSYWFPDTYMTIASYMQNKGVHWNNVSPQEVLGDQYSSASGFRRVASQVTIPQQQGGDKCSV